MSPRNHEKLTSSPRATKSPRLTLHTQNNHTASTAESVREVQRELVPSFLKALFISSDETIFDEDETTVGNTYSNLGLKSLTNSAEGAFSAPDALKIRMQEMSRSRSALANSQPTVQDQQATIQMMLLNGTPPVVKATSN